LSLHSLRLGEARLEPDVVVVPLTLMDDYRGVVDSLLRLTAERRLKRRI
jgi:hypothetical protein